MSLCLIGCKEEPVVKPSVNSNTSEPTELNCDEVTWHSFAHGYVNTWCTGCHGAAVALEDRQGAPLGMDFDQWSLMFSYRDRIQLVATGEQASMPPAGGVTEVDRALFETWLACGAEGEDEPPDACSGAEERVYVESMCDANAPIVVTTDVPASGSDLSCVCSIHGSLTVNSEISAPLLFAISGDLLVQSTVSSASLPALTTVGGELRVEGEEVTDVDLPLLYSAGGLFVSGAHLQTLSLVHLEELSGELLVTGADLEFVDLARLEVVQGAFELSSLPVLNSLLGLRAMRSISGPLVLSDMGFVTELDPLFMLLLQEVSSVTISNNLRLSSLSGLTLVEKVHGSVVIAKNPSLTEIALLETVTEIGEDLLLLDGEYSQMNGFLNLSSIGGDFVVDNVGPLSGVAGLERLTVVSGDFTIRESGSDFFSGPPLLDTVGGDLVLEDLGAQTVGGFRDLRRVEGDIVVTGGLVQELQGLSSLDHVAGEVRLVQMSALTELTAMSDLQAVGEVLFIRDNPSLQSIRGLNSLTDLGGLWLVNNPNLLSLQALQSISSITSDVNLSGNTSLPNGEVSDLLEAIGVENIGGVITVDN